MYYSAKQVQRLRILNEPHLWVKTIIGCPNSWPSWLNVYSNWYECDYNNKQEIRNKMFNNINATKLITHRRSRNVTEPSNDLIIFTYHDKSRRSTSFSLLLLIFYISLAILVVTCHLNFLPLRKFDTTWGHKI